jgi:hypothetical protein
MAAAASYSAEEVERAIQALYGGQNVAEADRWLTLYVASPAAWEISIAMITRCAARDSACTPLSFAAHGARGPLRPTG